MKDFVIKIEPGCKPRMVVCAELTDEWIQTEVEGSYEVNKLCNDLRNKHPNIRLLVNEDGKLFDLKANVIATLLHDKILNIVYGAAIFVVVERGTYRPLSADEASALRETILSSYDIEFEEGEE